MKIDFRNFPNEEIYKVIQKIKHDFYNNVDVAIIQGDLDCLEQKLQSFHTNLDIARNAYAHCLQSFVYLFAHANRKMSNYEIEIFDELFNRLEANFVNASDIWTDVKQGVNMFTTLANSNITTDKFIRRAAEIFKDYPDLLIQFEANNFTPFHAACKRGHLDVAQALNELTKRQSHANAQLALQISNKYGFTPLMSAYLYPEIVEFILNEIIISNRLRAINATNKNGETVLNMACSKGDAIETVEILLNHGADYTISDSAKRSPLHNACILGNHQVVDLLLDHLGESGACNTSLLLKDSCQETSFHKICYHGKEANTGGTLFNMLAVALENNILNECLYSLNGNNETILDISLRCNFDALQVVVEFAARYTLNDFMAYTQNIWLGDNYENIVLLLSTAEDNLSETQFHNFLLVNQFNLYNLLKKTKSFPDFYSVFYSHYMSCNRASVLQTNQSLASTDTFFYAEEKKGLSNEYSNQDNKMM